MGTNIVIEPPFPNVLATSTPGENIEAPKATSYIIGADSVSPNIKTFQAGNGAGKIPYVDTSLVNTKPVIATSTGLATSTTQNLITPSTAPANQFANGVDTSGIVAYAQPSFTDVSGTASVSQGGTGVTTISAGEVLVGNGSGAISSTPIENIAYPQFPQYADWDLNTALENGRYFSAIPDLVVSNAPDGFPRVGGFFDVFGSKEDLGFVWILQTASPANTTQCFQRSTVVFGSGTPAPTWSVWIASTVGDTTTYGPGLGGTQFLGRSSTGSYSFTAGNSFGIVPTTISTYPLDITHNTNLFFNELNQESLVLRCAASWGTPSTTIMDLRASSNSPYVLASVATASTLNVATYKQLIQDTGNAVGRNLVLGTKDNTDVDFIANTLNTFSVTSGDGVHIKQPGTAYPPKAKLSATLDGLAVDFTRTGIFGIKKSIISNKVQSIAIVNQTDASVIYGYTKEGVTGGVLSPYYSAQDALDQGARNISFNQSSAGASLSLSGTAPSNENYSFIGNGSDGYQINTVTIGRARGGYVLTYYASGLSAANNININEVGSRVELNSCIVGGAVTIPNDGGISTEFKATNSLITTLSTSGRAYIKLNNVSLGQSFFNIANGSASQNSNAYIWNSQDTTLFVDNFASYGPNFYDIRNAPNVFGTLNVFYFARMSGLSLVDALDVQFKNDGSINFGFASMSFIDTYNAEYDYYVPLRITSNNNTVQLNLSALLSTSDFGGTTLDYLKTTNVGTGVITALENGGNVFGFGCKESNVAALDVSKTLVIGEHQQINITGVGNLVIDNLDNLADISITNSRIGMYVYVYKNGGVGIGSLSINGANFIMSATSQASIDAFNASIVATFVKLEVTLWTNNAGTKTKEITVY